MSSDVAKHQFFEPNTRNSKFSPNKIHRISSDPDLVGHIADSDPYDQITYYLDGEPMATEYVADWQHHLDGVRSNLFEFADALRLFRSRS